MTKCLYYGNETRFVLTTSEKHGIIQLYDKCNTTGTNFVIHCNTGRIHK